jgi:hypothetical protein
MASFTDHFNKLMVDMVHLTAQSGISIPPPRLSLAKRLPQSLQPLEHSHSLSTPPWKFTTIQLPMTRPIAYQVASRTVPPPEDSKLEGITYINMKQRCPNDILRLSARVQV